MILLVHHYHLFSTKFKTFPPKADKRLKDALTLFEFPQAFAQEGLVDCGFDTSMRSLICTPRKTEQEETDLPLTYREVTYKDKKFTWTDKLQ